jgi:hypothetical protein
VDYALWEPGQYGKALLVRPRKDREEDFSLYTFSDRSTHNEVMHELGVATRVVVAFLIKPHGAYNAITFKDAPENVNALIVRLDSRLQPGEPNFWNFNVR